MKSYKVKIKGFSDKVYKVDNIEEKLVEYMFDIGEYSETNNKFYTDKEELTNLVIKELYSRVREVE